jgi:hypothetical protein
MPVHHATGRDLDEGPYKRGSARPARPSRTAAATRKLHKRLHTYRTFDAEQVGLNEKAPISGAFAGPSDGLETVDPLLPHGTSEGYWWQPVATDFPCFRGFGAIRFATDCHRLQPRGSIRLHRRLSALATGSQACGGGNAERVPMLLGHG